MIVSESHRGVDDVLVVRCRLGACLALCRREAGLSQPELGQLLGRTRSLISKVEHGARTMPAELWAIADEVCNAQGALVAEHTALEQAQRDYRDRCRTQRRRQIHQAQADVPETSPATLGGRVGELTEELMAVVTELIRRLGRRDAIRLVGGMLTVAGMSGLDFDEFTRVAHAVAAPRRVDGQVVTNLAVTLAHCKRQEDMLGPRQVLDTVMAQHGLVRRLLAGGCPDRLRGPLSLVDSNMACTIGGYLVDMGQPTAASRYFGSARRAAHDARNAPCAAYAATNSSLAAFVRADTPTALDTAAAARSLAARTGDVRLQALAEQMASAAYALDGQHRPCMAACDRAHSLLSSAHGNTPESLAYWLHHGNIDSQRSKFLALLGRPTEAVEAASTAQAHYDRTYVGRYALCEVRLAHALVLDHDITEAAHVLADAAAHAHLFPRLTAELHTVRALMHPWDNTAAVQNLDDQLRSHKIIPAHPTMT